MPRLGFRSLVVSLLAAAAILGAQERPPEAVETRLALDRLRVLGSVLMIGAHPDDERTDTLAYFARGRLMRTAYLSVTRGEGGQNLLGPEQGDLLGLIRTQELLAARRIDGAEQYFTRAIDFGFSKSADETLAKWGRERILSDIVWVIRRFRPDVIVLCFSGTTRDGHGHHQAAGILGREAFAAAADPARFPEQLQWVEAWQAKRLVWNVYGRAEGANLRISTGDYNPLLGRSYAEIASLSRSMHRSQGMGNPARRGPVSSEFVPVAGPPASTDLFDGIDTSWARVPGGAAVAAALQGAWEAFDPSHPERIVPQLLEARRRIAALRHPWAERKLAEIDAVIAACAGLWLDAPADRWSAAPGETIAIRPSVINRSPLSIKLVGLDLGEGGASAARNVELAYNQPFTDSLTLRVPDGSPYAQPFWLVEPKQGDTYTIRNQLLIGEAENPPLWQVHFRLRFGADDIDFYQPVRYRYTDRLRGELVRPVVVVPSVAVQAPAAVLVFPDQRPKRVEVVLKANTGATGQLRLEAPAGWRVAPPAREFRMAPGEELTLAFEVAPAAEPARGRVRAVATVNQRQIASGMDVISYPYFPPQVVFPPAEAATVRSDIRVLARRVGYVMGAGDEVPDALRQLGCEVTLLSAGDLESGDLGAFDAIVTGVRAYNVRADLRANQARLLDYVQKGGTLVVQYNTLEFGASAGALSGIGPYSISVSRDRVSVEEAPVALTAASSPLLSAPNRITAADFDGWVQERALYLPGEWDAHYQTLFESHDPGEPPHTGGTLYTRYGGGAYVFTAYSWFRQLPAGVPGAFRIFANLLSAGKVLHEQPSR
ncbi:MAG: PIG-L family deacetylase [Bryobacteraceae bacterium]|jgi:LmbE family N-acetylglucosaminyl deacetylase